MDELREQNAHPAKNLHSMSPFFLALLFLSPLIAYAVSILLNEARDPIEIRDLGLGNLNISHDDEYSCHSVQFSQDAASITFLIPLTV